MTVASTNNRNNYVGNGSTNDYDYTFRIFEDADLLVTVRDPDGVETTLTLTTHYTVSDAGSLTGGTVSLVNGAFDWLDAGGDLDTGYALTIRRVLDLTQGTDIRNQGSYFPANTEDALDRLTMQQQQQQDEIDRGIKLPETLADSFDGTLPGTAAEAADRAGRALIFNAAGDGMDIGPTATEISGAQAASDAAVAAAAAAIAAAASAQGLWRDTVFIVGTPYNVTAADRGKVLDVDTSGTAIVINLPTISTLDLTSAFPVTIRKSSTGDINLVTINRGGTDTIDGATSLTLRTGGQGAVLIPDVDTFPDRWTTLAISPRTIGYDQIAGVAAVASPSGANEVATVNPGTFLAEKFTLSKLPGVLSLQDAKAVQNLRINATVATNAMTIALKTLGGTDPAAGDPVYVGFRNATAATGLPSTVAAVAATSLVVSSGSTLGTQSAVAQPIYVYAINNAGTLELAISTRLFDEGSLVSTTAEGGAGAADSNSVMYSTTARTSVACRLIGRIVASQTTAGTWAAAPSEIALPPFELALVQMSAQRSTTQSIPNNTSTVAVFPTVLTDSHGGLNTATGVYTAPRAGIATVFASGLWTGSATGVRQVVVTKNGSSIGGDATDTSPAGNFSQRATAKFTVAAGDTIDVRVFQTSGGALNFAGFSQIWNQFQVEIK